MNSLNKTKVEPTKNNQSMDRSYTGIQDSVLKSLYRIGGAAVVLQLLCSLVIIIVIFTLGLKPDTAIEYFTILQDERLIGLLRDDFLHFIIISLYLVTFFALYYALRRVNDTFVTFAVLLTFISVAVCFATHSGFSMLRLSDQYAAAVIDTQRSQFLAAGEAIIASDMWNSTAGFMAGILLQGAGVLISIIMLRSSNFSKITAYAGIVANGFDLAQHLIHPFAPSIASIPGMIAGLSYLIWFPMLGRDLFRLGRLEKNIIVERQGAILL